MTDHVSDVEFPADLICDFYMAFIIFFPEIVKIFPCRVWRVTRRLLSPRRHHLKRRESSSIMSVVEDGRVWRCLEPQWTLSQCLISTIMRVKMARDPILRRNKNINANGKLLSCQYGGTFIGYYFSSRFSQYIFNIYTTFESDGHMGTRSRWRRCIHPYSFFSYNLYGVEFVYRFHKNAAFERCFQDDAKEILKKK